MFALKYLHLYAFLALNTNIFFLWETIIKVRLNVCRLDSRCNYILLRGPDLQ